MDNSLKIRKVDIMAMTELLLKLHDIGVDFIDIHGIIKEEEDTIRISFSKEYMNKDYVTNFENIDMENLTEIEYKLNDDDIDQLL